MSTENGAILLSLLAASCCFYLLGSLISWSNSITNDLAEIKERIKQLTKDKP